MASSSSMTSAQFGQRTLMSVSVTSYGARSGIKSSSGGALGAGRGRPFLAGALAGGVLALAGALGWGELPLAGGEALLAGALAATGVASARKTIPQSLQRSFLPSTSAGAWDRVLHPGQVMTML